MSVEGHGQEKDWTIGQNFTIMVCTIAALVVLGLAAEAVISNA